MAYGLNNLARTEFALGHFEWRQIFVALSAVVLVLSLLFAVWVPEHAGKSRPAPLAGQLAGLRRILGDGAFWRIALALGASQAAAVSLFTLWMTAWLRDVAGFDRAAGARALAWVALALILGYFFFGRLADAFARRGRSPLPLFAGGVAGALVMLALLAMGVTRGAVLLWSAFVFFGTGATVANSIATRRYPREMAGRVNTMLNTFTFTGTFVGQWATGAVLNLFPPTALGYDPRGYFYALWALWLVQAAGLAWLWTGRKLVYVLK